MTKLRQIWLCPCHRNLQRHSAAHNALLRSQRSCRRQLRHHPRPRSLREEDAKGQLARQVQFLTGGSTLIALKVPLQDPYDLTIAVRSG
jgi:hypothetical protein